MLARYELRSGRHVEARNRLRRRIEAASSATARAEARLVIAESFQKQGEDARCLHELVRAAVDSRGTRFEPERLRLRARSQRRLGRRSDALETYRELARRFPSHPAADDALYEVGWIREGRRQFRSGERAYLACLRAYPRGTLADDALLRAGLCALRGGRAADASAHFAALVKRFPESSLLDNALYWRMVAQQRRGDAVGALALRDRLERDFPRSYYSVLARQRIERSLAGGASVAAQGAEPQPVLELDDGLARADRVHDIYTAAIGALRSLPELAPPAGFEAEARLWRFLLDHGLAVEAGWEARRLERRFGSEPGALLELLAHSHARGSTERLVRLAYRLSQQVDDTAVRPALEILSYPAPFTPSLAEAAARHGLSHATVLGLVRQESAFDPRIDSAAGARGLMQLMPAVGARLARREGQLDHHVDDLYRPEVNVELGCQLLADELRLAHGDVPQALAAYNAGSGPAAAWRARLEPHEPAELYLDIAEYVETRTYLESVLGNREVYARVYALP
jgi:soluble lytic murein transglycosylase